MSSSHSQPDMSLTSIKKDMEAAKLQLEAYSVTLTDLISKIGKSLSYTVGDFHYGHFLVLCL